jgi:phage baseplate assembly protein W
MEETESAFIGTGWGWPPTFSSGLNEVGMTSGTEDINKSLEILLGTTLGERMMHPSFGCNMEKLLYEPITTTLRNYMKTLVDNAVLYFESRITLDNVNLEHDETNGIIKFHIEYTVTGTNTRTNLVYPFYLEEGTNL